MENTYLKALHGMETIIPDWENPMGSFNKKSYMGVFKEYYEKHLDIYEALETGYISAVDKDQYLLNMANAVVESAVSAADEVKKKSKKNAKMIDLNLCMVVYVLPGILKYGGESAQPFIDILLKRWKEQFPSSNISAAPFEDIEAGFHKKWCYITTAVCETLGKPDDCYELTLFRNYRDGYLSEQPDGEEAISEYYDVAPTIVKRINRLPDRREIYESIWKQYLNPCVSLIEGHEEQACKELYIKMVRDLQEKYFYNN